MTGLSSGWPRVAQGPKFRILPPRRCVLRPIEYTRQFFYRTRPSVSGLGALRFWKCWHYTDRRTDIWPVFSQPSIYIDGWLYGLRMTSVVCNVPVLSQNDSTYHHSVFTTWKWHPFATWTPSFIILVYGHHPLIGAKPYLPASRTLVIIKMAKLK